MQEQISAIQKLINTTIEYSVSYGFQVLGALIVLAAGVKIIIPNKDIGGQVIQETMAGFPEVASRPKPQVGIQEFADFSVNIAYRYWVPTEKYFQNVHAVNLAVYKAINKARINIPFPRRDVHLVSEPSITGR